MPGQSSNARHASVFHLDALSASAHVQRENWSSQPAQRHAGVSSNADLGSSDRVRWPPQNIYSINRKQGVYKRLRVLQNKTGLKHKSGRSSLEGRLAQQKSVSALAEDRRSTLDVAASAAHQAVLEDLQPTRPPATDFKSSSLDPNHRPALSSKPFTVS